MFSRKFMSCFCTAFYCLSSLQAGEMAALKSDHRLRSREIIPLRKESQDASIAQRNKKHRSKNRRCRSRDKRITESGCYCLANDFCGTICIEANDVTLDLNCHQIDAAGADSAVIIFGHTNVTVKNGTINNACEKGVAVNDSRDVTLSNLTLQHNKSIAMQLSNCEGFQIDNCNFSFNSTALILSESNSGTVSNCNAYQNTHTGPELLVDDLLWSAIVIAERCDCLTFSDVDICNNTKDVPDATYQTGSFLLVLECTNVDAIRCRVNGNTNEAPVLQSIVAFFTNITNYNITDCQVNDSEIVFADTTARKEFNAIGVSGGKSGVISGTETNNNMLISTGGSSPRAYILNCFGGVSVPYLVPGDDLVVSNFRSNNNRLEAEVGDMRAIYLSSIPSKQISGCQANNNYAPINCLGVFINDDNTRSYGSTITNCQANNNRSDGLAIGIGAVNADSVIVTNCQANNNVQQGDLAFFGFLQAAVGMNFTIDSNVVIKGCEANGNYADNGFSAGISVDNAFGFAPSVSMSDCIARDNGSTFNNAFGIQIAGIPKGIITNCQVYDTVTSSTTMEARRASGLEIRSSSDVVLQNCQVFGSQAEAGAAYGINIVDSERCTLERCEANDSASTDNDAHGIVLQGSTQNSKVQDSSAIGNQNDGFADLATTQNGFFGNTAQDNGIDYFGVTNAAVVFDAKEGTFDPTPPNRWSNIAIVNQ